MPAQATSTSPAERVLERIVQERFTGLLRVSSHEASGEFWFLAGTLEEARFGVSKGEEARERLLRATHVVFQAELRLPYVNGGFKKPMPISGSFADFRPVVLMRHCESYALTCALELRGKNRTVRLTYRIGELLSADATPPGNDALPALLESEEGSYEFVLPSFELPEGVNTPVASASRLPLAERIDRLLAEEAAAAAETTQSAGQGPPNKKPEAVEAAEAEARLKAQRAATAEAERKAAEAAAAAEAQRKAAAAEAERKAAQAAAAAEAQRKAAAAEAERKAAEAERKAAEAAAAAEAQRKASEAERKALEAEAERKAAEAAAAAEAQRKAVEAEAERTAAEATAKAKREREELEAVAANAKKGPAPSGVEQPANTVVPSSSEPQAKSVERRPEPAPIESDEEDEHATAVTPKRGFPWFWLFLAVLLAALAYFTKERLGLR